MGSSKSKFITLLIFRMAVMTPYPHETNRVFLAQIKEFLPKVLICSHFLFISIPIIRFPSMGPTLLHSFD